MENDNKAIAVLGNVTLDIICKTVDEVPRQASIAFQEAAVTPGGCGSNTSVGLARQGEQVFLIACTGNDQVADLLFRFWEKTGVNTHFVQRISEIKTGVSVGLVDSSYQPRFIHTAGANARLSKDFLSHDLLSDCNIGFLYIAGYFVLPGLLDMQFVEVLQEANDQNIFTALDVVSSPAMEDPEYLWPLLPKLDLFMCNLREAEQLAGLSDPGEAGGFFQNKGARRVIIKLGAEGCWFFDGSQECHIPAPKVKHVIDTTGAGDAFAAGLLAALRKGQDLPSACRAGNQLGAKNVEFLGAVETL